MEDPEIIKPGVQYFASSIISFVGLTYEYSPTLSEIKVLASHYEEGSFLRVKFVENEKIQNLHVNSMDDILNREAEKLDLYPNYLKGGNMIESILQEGYDLVHLKDTMSKIDEKLKDKHPLYGILEFLAVAPNSQLSERWRMQVRKFKSTNPNHDQIADFLIEKYNDHLCYEGSSFVHTILDPKMIEKLRLSKK